MEGESGSGYMGQLTLTATNRLARDLTRRYERAQMAAGKRTFQRAPVSYLGAWLSEIWAEWLYSGGAESPDRLLRPFEEQIVWEEIIRSAPEGQLLNVAATAALAQDAWKEVCDGRIPLDAAEWNLSEDSVAFHSWAQEFRGRCQDNGWFSSAELPAIVAGLITGGEVPVPSRVELAGFFDPTPAQNRLFKALEGRGTRIGERAPPAHKPSGVRVAFSDTDREVRAAARWSRSLVEDDPDAANPDFSIGIIAPGLSQLRSRIERIFGQEFHPRSQLHPDQDGKRLFNISLGLPLGAYPLVKAAFLLLEANPRSIPISVASRLVRSPFLPAADEECTKRALLDAELRSLGEYYVTAADIRYLSGKADTQHYCPILADRIALWKKRYEGLPDHALPSEWADALADHLRSAGWPGSRALDSDEHQTLNAWQELVADLAGLDGIRGRVRLKSAIGLLRKMAAARLFQPESLPAPVQIMGHYEASGLEFSRLWLLGMHDNIWPSAPASNPFVPQPLRRRMRLSRSTPELELEFAKGLTSRLVSSAPSLVVSYPNRDGDADTHVSPLFGAFPERTPEDLGESLSGSHAKSLCGTAPVEWLEDHDGPPFDAAVAKGGISPFKLQAACPFKAFAELRLEAAALESPGPGLSALDRGKLIHRVLERIWDHLKSSEVLLSMSDEELEAVVRERVVSELELLSAHRRILKNGAYARIEQARLEGIAAEWLALEKKREPFRTLEQEEERSVTVGGLGVSIRVDRIDRLQDGSCVIIDYKTGQCSTRAWQGHRPDEPQLPIYAVTSEVPLAGVFFGSLKPGEIRFKGIAEAPDIVPFPRPSNAPLPSQVMGEWQDALERLGSEFLAGRAVVDPKDPNQTCRNCALPGFCRIGQTEKEQQESDG